MPITLDGSICIIIPLVFIIAKIINNRLIAIVAIGNRITHCSVIIIIVMIDFVDILTDMVIAMMNIVIIISSITINIAKKRQGNEEPIITDRTVRNNDNE